ncbi:helix-turn-helix transcriptional regulator [Actinomyces sp. ZJ308]|uniref:helix-turn-helix domain-containing protein n=1 Tax=Actinomyces sp. ZJ308 TaxID=2708342 RepID=UPI001423A267|nr:helix-turn-helix transcriptional regulator [Actinomyces sp. ZJ308]
MATSLRQRLGANLRAERRRRQLTQEDLAERLGVTARYLGGIERAERNLTLDSVDALAQDLGIDALDLLANTPAEGPIQRP